MPPKTPCKRGDVALVLFPNSDLRTAKTRPALVVQAGDTQMAGLIETAIAVRRHRKLLEDRPMFCELGPPEAFSDELATDRDFQRLCNGLDPALTGPQSRRRPVADRQ